MKSKKISVKFDQNLCDFGGLVFSLVVVAVELAVSPIPGRSPRQTRWPSESQTVEVTALWFAQTKWQFTRFTVGSGAVPKPARDVKAGNWVWLFSLFTGVRRDS